MPADAMRNEKCKMRNESDLARKPNPPAPFPKREGGERQRLVPLHTITQAQVQLSASRPVRTQMLDVAGEVRPHDHDYYEISMGHAGSATHETDHYGLPFGNGTVVIIAPGQTHAFSSVKKLRVTNIYYLAEWLLTELRALWENDGLVPLFLAASLFRRPISDVRVPQFSLTPEESADCARELADIAAELTLPQPSLVLLKSSLLKFLIRLARSHNERLVHRGDAETRRTNFEGEEGRVGRRHSPPPLAGEGAGGRGVRCSPSPLEGEGRVRGSFGFRPEIWTALDSVEESIRQSTPFSVDALADQAGLSTDHLSRLFKEATGWPPMDYFQRRRIHHACTWLLNPRHSITDVALALGFSDAAHFSRLFRQHQGLTPRDYRKMYAPK